MYRNGGIVNALEKLDVLKDVYGDDASFDRVLGKLLETTLSDYVLRRQKQEQSLAEFEVRYDMRSDIFYRRFEAGELGDEMDFFEWSGLYELYQDLSSKIHRLEQAV
jgi:hypothetical protein